MLKNLKIKGGVHGNAYTNYLDYTEADLEKLVYALMEALHKNTKSDGYITIEYTKVIGGKTHS